MSNSPKNKVTICLVNYKTLELTRLCLRCIRRFTREPYEVIVVDNNSADASLDYLRSVPWITLIERDGYQATGSLSHASALDLGLDRCRHDLFLSMHSDTIVFREGWLDRLVDRLTDRPGTACVGTGKLDLISPWYQRFKAMTDFGPIKRALRGQGPVDRRHYNRSICCLYRADILKQEKLTFEMGHDEGLTVGQKLYLELLARGYPCVVLPPQVLRDDMHHLAHATMVFNPEFSIRSRTQRKTRKLTKTLLASEPFASILHDDSLDR